MGKLIDLTGIKFGRLTVIDPIKKENSTAMFWKCKCDCGNIVEVYGYSLRAKNGTRSCGCIQREIASNKNFEDLSGKRFGDNVTVIRRVDDKIRKNGRHIVQWLCISDGGEEFICEPYSLKHLKHHAEKIYYIPKMRQYFEKYGLTEEQMKSNTPYSTNNITVICPECGREK